MGSHTSILISESLEGLKVAATRQNAGSCWKTAFSCAAPRPASGSENCPAATAWADVMVAFSSESDFKLSQVAAATGAGANATIVTASTNKTKLKLRKFIVHSLDRRYSSAIEAESYHAPDYAQDQGQPETHWASLSNSIVMPLRGT